MEKVRDIGIIAHISRRSDIHRISPETPGFWRSLRSLFSYTGKTSYFFPDPLFGINMLFSNLI
ncbi:MAG: hypothetical protein UY23_C0005G0013 [Candidatus Jorgensenbacteria bacterium GW2011_GWA1_48_11]|uniref:Uncharacterized protein n=1 Tax=Candidatus Jorgensenbacteria bacterium GW2011_GWA1_48_11 TaxID=1618660 RepID=A0A0G1U9W7_9BACT|nr:MAG: hypothetical protein UY23_C0005G0013 [Candidatus Jorgensenbacteria bacterium GW2011_GWA1_48_11]KKW12352.1 MAG: hypothetical protein UY51_C0005G0594 [Candidatus Jorgensenbacteria bacterium GW2011_GWB1_49_9]